MIFRFTSLCTLLGALALAGGAGAQSPDLPTLHDALHLTAAQEDGWRAYKAAIAPDPAAQGRRRAAAMMMPTLTTPRRIDLIDAEMSEDTAVAHRQGAAVKAFYAGLTPTQQRAFDHETLQTGRSGGGFRGGASTASGGGLRQTGSGPQLRQPPTDTLHTPQQP